MMKAQIVSLFLVCCIVPQLFGGDCLAQGSAPIPQDPALVTGRLDNGFSYYIRRNKEPKKKVLMYLVNKVGSIVEDADQLGLAHFLEHMNFNGTKQYPKNKLEDFLEKAGVRFGADLNAYTSQDETVFELPLPTDDPALVKAGVGIIRDWAQNALLETAEIDKERGVILEELRLSLGKDTRLREQYLPALLGNSRYAYRLPIGNAALLKSFPADALRRFHRDWYRPNLQALIVVGDIDAAGIEKEIKKRFADLKNPENQRVRPDYSIRLDGRNRFIVATDKEQSTISLNILFKQKTPVVKSQEDYLNAIRKDFLMEVLSRRYQRLDQEPGKKFLQASAGFSGFMGGLDAFSFMVVPKEGQLESAFKQGWQVIEQALRYGITREELDVVRKNYKQNMLASVKEAENRHSMSFVNQYKELFLKGVATPSLSWKVQFMKDHVESIQPADLQQLLRTIITDENRAYLIMAPTDPKKLSAVPDSTTVLKWIRDVQQGPLTPYQELVVAGALLSTIPTGGKVIKRTTDKNLDLISLKLSNGVRVILKKTDFQNNQVLFTGFLPGGISLSDSTNYLAAADCTGLLGRMGAGRYNDLQLQKLMTGKMAGVGAYMNGRFHGVNGSATTEDLESALQLLHLRVTEPRTDTALYNSMMGDMRQSLLHKYENPVNIFRDTVGYILGGYNYRSRPFTVDRLAQLDLDKAMAYYKARFSNFSGATFIFVGNIQEEIIRPLLETYLGSLPSQGHIEEPKDIDLPIPGGKRSVTVKAGTEQKATVQLVVSGQYDYTDVNNLGIYFLGQILQIRLLESLREDAGEVYSPSVNASYHKYPVGRYSFMVSFGCAPDNVDHLLGLIGQEFSKLRSSGPSAGDLDKVKTAYRKQMQQSLTNNSYWLRYLADQIQNGDDLDFILKLEDHLNQITPGMLQGLSDKVLNGENQIDFRLLPQE